MSKTAGIIFSNIHDRKISELTKQRTMAAVPFMCRYRLVDFSLSNMVNCGITNINIITHCNYNSLVEHIGSGKDWDMARHSGGIRLLSPYITAYANNLNSLYDTRLEALKSIGYTIDRLTEDHVVLSDCDGIYNMELSRVIAYHEAEEADITLVAASGDVRGSSAPMLVFDENMELRDLYTKPISSHSATGNASMNLCVINTRLLRELMLDAAAHDYTDFSRDIIAKNIGTLRIKGYLYGGYYANIGSFSDYYAHSMELLSERELMLELFSPSGRHVYTRVRNSPPTGYQRGAQVVNSLLSDGCVIRGRVENSIIFRGARIEEGASVRNSIIFQNCIVGEGASLNCVVADKEVVVRSGSSLSGHRSLPYYISKGLMI